jgi:hypothetical protein
MSSWPRAAWAVLAVAAPACSAQDAASRAEAREPAAAGQTTTQALLEEFHRVVQRERTRGGDGSDARLYLRGLAEGERLPVARAVARDPDPTVAFLAVPILVEAGREHDAVPAVVGLVVGGHDLGALYYYLNHLDDETRGARLLIRTSRQLLRGHAQYQGMARERVEAFLVEPPTPFSTDEAERRIVAMERRLRDAESGRGRASPSPTLHP